MLFRFSRLLSCLVVALPAAATYYVGEQPPDFTCDDTAGNPWTLSEHRGQVVMINFGQTGSQPCDSSFAHLQPDFVDHYDPAVFTLVHIDAANQDAQGLIDYWSYFNPAFPILTMCGDLFADWCEAYVPHTVILDPLGIVQGNWVGFFPPFWDQMHETIQLAVNPTGLYVDDWTLDIAGDGDQVLEPGESAGLTITLANLGQEAVAGVSGELQSLSPWVAVTQTAGTWPDFAPGASHDSQGAFTLSVDAGAPAAMDVPFELHLGTSQGEAVLRFTLEVGQRVPYWSCDVESGTEEWSHTSTAGWNDVWHLSTESSQSPTHAWKAGSTGTGNYGNHDDCWLVSPPLALQDWSRLTFAHRMDAEISATFPDSAYDGGTVEISVDDGASWTQLMPLTGYNKAFRALSGGGNPASHNFPGQTPCYSGSFPWEPAVFDLSDYNGQTVRFGFHFGSDNGGALEGWYVDDLVLAAPAADTELADPASGPESADLLRAWPNPFNPRTRVTVELASAGEARVELFDLAGRRVRTLAAGPLPAGRTELALDGAGLAGGLYLLRLETPRQARSLKVLLVR